MNSDEGKSYLWPVKSGRWTMSGAGKEKKGRHRTDWIQWDGGLEMKVHHR
jgi:hypothetical protein